MNMCKFLSHVFAGLLVIVGSTYAMSSQSSNQPAARLIIDNQSGAAVTFNLGKIEKMAISGPRAVTLEPKEAMTYNITDVLQMGRAAIEFDHMYISSLVIYYDGRDAITKSPYDNIHFFYRLNKDGIKTLFDSSSASCVKLTIKDGSDKGELSYC